MANAIQIGSNEYPLSIEAMFYALENGTGASGTFTLESALPNTETLIAETGLEEIHGLMFLAKGYFEDVQASASKQTTGLGISVYSGGELIKGLCSFRNHSSVATIVDNTEPAPPVKNGTIRIDGGDVYCTAKYNNNANYTPFEPGIEYRWIAW